jgi:hypothetical protein
VNKRVGAEETFPKWTFEALDDGSITKIKITHEFAVKQISWHCKGDYLCTVSPEG